MKIAPTVAATLCTCLGLAACDARGPGSPTTTTTRTVTTQTCNYRVMDPATRAQFEKALAAKSVKYEVVESRDGHGGVIFGAHDADCDAFSEIRIAVVGAPLPSGRHMGFDPGTQAQFVAWLTTQGIPYETRTHDGHEYVIWKAEDAERVMRWEHFPRGLPGYDLPQPGAPGKGDGVTPPRS